MMKSIKKMFVMLLTVSLLLTVCVPAFAAGEGITPIHSTFADNEACDFSVSFPTTTQNDGKVWVNKAVSDSTINLKKADGTAYTGSALSALSAGDDDFVVSLMTLAQSYKRATESGERTKLNVVFAIDISTSMKNNMLTGVNNETVPRINVLKDAAKSFIDRLAAIGDETDVNLSIVTYNGSARTVFKWSTIGSVEAAKAANMTEAKNAITYCDTKTTSSKYYLSVGNTNAQAGLYLANYLYTDAIDKPANVDDEDTQNFIVFMTDGGPNRYFESEDNMPVTRDSNGYYHLPLENATGLSRTITNTDYRREAATSAFEQVEKMTAINNFTLYTLGLSEWFTTSSADSRFPTAVNFMKLCAAIGNGVKDSQDRTVTAQLAADTYCGTDVLDGAMPGQCPSFPVLDATDFATGTSYSIKTNASTTISGLTYERFQAKYLELFGDYETRLHCGIETIEENLDYSIKNYYAGNTSAKFNASFEDIAYHIILSLSDFVTDVSSASAADISGYVNIIDDIGEYMEVKEIKGVFHDGTLYDGKEFARIFSTLDWLFEDNVTYDTFRSSLFDRCGIPSGTNYLTDIFSGAIAARTIYYNSDSDYSSYLYWYANADRKYVGSYYEADGTLSPQPENAVYLIKSYFTWGAAASANTPDTDMFFVSVAVAEELAYGVESVYFNVPASLLPVRTVDVRAADGNTEAYVSNNALPIALLYSVGLKENLTEVRDGYSYLDPDNGVWSFYTNAWESDQYQGCIPTFATFEPAIDNPYYYAVNDTLLYTHSNGVYSPATAYDVNQEYYYSETYYDDAGSHSVYTKLTRNLETLGNDISADHLLYISDTDGYLYKVDGAPKITQYNSAAFEKSVFPEGNESLSSPMYKVLQFILSERDDGLGIKSTVVSHLGNNGRLDVNTVDLTIKKVWNDNNNALGQRPQGITFNVYQDGVLFRTVNVTQADCTLKDGVWVYTLADVPFGYAYTVVEAPIQGYDASYSDDGMTVTNTVSVEQEVVLDYGLQTEISLPETVNGIQAASYELNARDSSINFGQAEISVSTLFYTPVTTEWNGYDTVKYTITLADADATEVTGIVKVMPATNVYFEDSFLTFTDGASATWTEVGTNDASARQDGTNSYVYGYDPAYSGERTFSNGSSMKTTVTSSTKPAWPTASFSFYGTMVDIISYTGADTGLISIMVTNAETGARVKALAVNTVYEDAGDYGDIYQIPVLRCDTGAYGHYNVTLTVAYSGYFDTDGSGAYDGYIDAVRVFNPAGVSLNSGTIHDRYSADDELNPTVAQLRDTLLSSDDAFSVVNGSTGSMYVSKNPFDGTGGSLSTALALYRKNGPNHEVYLERGDAIAFQINGYTGKEKLHISAKSPNLEGKEAPAILTINAQQISFVDSSAEQYYNITDSVSDDGIVVITNSGENILSLVDFKMIAGSGEFVSNSVALDEAIEILDNQESQIESFKLPDTLSFDASLVYDDTKFDFAYSVPSTGFTVVNVGGVWTASATVMSTDAQIMAAERSAGIAATHSAKTQYRVITARWDGNEWETQDFNFKYITNAEKQQNDEAMKSINVILKFILDFFAKFFKSFFGVA